MRNTLIIMTLAILGLAGLAFYRDGTPALMRGLFISGRTLIEILPLLAVAFAVAGLVSQVTSTQAVNKWLGQASGFRGILLAAVAGAIVPGGPYIFFPLAATLLVSGARIGTVIAFLTAKNLWTLSRLPMEFALLDARIVIIRYAVTFVFPVLLGLLGNMLFSASTDKLRQSVARMQNQAQAENPGKGNKKCS